MRRLLIFIIVLLIVGWYCQNYTSFKAFDIAKSYYQQYGVKLKLDEYWQKTKSQLSNFSLKIIPDFGQPAAEKQLNIFIRDNRFIPNMNAIQAGAKVTWYNEDDEAHTVTGDSWGSEQLKPGQKFSKTFNAAGKYSYHCPQHPEMTGEIIVE